MTEPGYGGGREGDTHDLPLDTFDVSPDEVRARAEWAVRRGQPLWLWPDVQPGEWQQALGRIAAAARQVLTGGSAPDALTGDADVLGVAAFTSGMGPLLGWWIETGRLPATVEVAALLRLHLRHNRLRMERLAGEAGRVVRAISAEGVVPTVLKGMHTAHAYFPAPATRPLSDLDLLVRRGEIAAVSQALRASGYVLRYEQSRPYGATWTPRGAGTDPRSLSLLHAEDPFSIDVHDTLDRNFFGSMFGLGALPRGEGRPWSVAPSARVLGQPVLALLLAAHTSQGFHSLTLVRLAELAMVIRADAASGALEWADLCAAAGAAGGLRFIYPALKLCEDLVPGTVPAHVLAACDADATPAMRAALARLTPSTAQSMGRMSVRERFMWAASPWARARQVAYELWPGRSFGNTLIRYRQIAWQLLRGTLRR
jgi:hypothetical protein